MIIMVIKLTVTNSNWMDIVMQPTWLMNFMDAVFMDVLIVSQVMVVHPTDTGHVLEVYGYEKLDINLLKCGGVSGTKV